MCSDTLGASVLWTNQKPKFLIQGLSGSWHNFTAMLPARLLRSALTGPNSRSPFRVLSRNKFYMSKNYAKSCDSSFTMTKVVATVGPGSDDPTVLQGLVDEGMRIMRLNFSHATFEEAEGRLGRLRASKGVHTSHRGNNFNLRACLLDTQGPEIRTGPIEGGAVMLTEGSTIELVCDPSSPLAAGGGAASVFVNYEGLAKCLVPGNQVLLDDGLISLTVTQVGEGSVTCTVDNSGELGSKKGVNLPGVNVDLPAMTDKDKKDLTWGVENDVDFIAASFVRKAEDVRAIRSFLTQEHNRVWGPEVPLARIISKIENQEGLNNFDDILAESDGIMVARGDLGVEIPLEQVFLAQKQMVAKCNEAGKPVIVATQMLDSMITNPRPTRAEVSDVGNAVLDGADSVMLSGETAKGRWPQQSVRTMGNIIREADAEYDSEKGYLPRRVDGLMGLDQLRPGSRRKHVMAVSGSAVTAAKALDAALIIVITENGNTARLVARHRPQVPVMSFCRSVKVARQLQIHRGLFPVATDDAKMTQAEAIRSAKELGWAKPGDVVVVLSSSSADSLLGEQTLMRVAEVV